LTIKGRYFKYIRSANESMEIHQVFMLWNNLFSLVYSRSTSFWNLANFFRLWAKKDVQTLQKELQVMHQRHIQQNDDDEVHLMSKTMNLNDKRCNLFLELQDHPWFMTLKHTVITHLMLINLLTSSSNLNPPYIIKHFNIKKKDVIRCG
jgi:hypothetical protein